MLPASVRARAGLAASRASSRSFSRASTALRPSRPAVPVASTSKATLDTPSTTRRGLASSAPLHDLGFLHPSAPLHLGRRGRISLREEDRGDEGGDGEGESDEPKIPIRRPGVPESDQPRNGLRSPSAPESSSAGVGSGAEGGEASSGSGGASSGAGDGGESGSSLAKRSVPDVYPQVMALPITRRPLFPGFYKAVVIRDANVIKAIKESIKRGQPYIGAFLLKDENDDRDVCVPRSLLSPPLRRRPPPSSTY